MTIMRCKRKIPLMFLCLAFSVFLYGQENRERIRITTTPFQYIFHDFPISIEKRFDRHTIGLTFSYRPDTKDGGKAGEGQGFLGGYKMRNFWNPLYQAVTFGINSKYYFPRMNNWYIDTRLFYRHWWFDDKYAYFLDAVGYSFDGLRTERQNVFGLKLLFGRTFAINTQTRVFPLIDIYGGFGTRYRFYDFVTRNGTVNDVFHEHLHERGNYWMRIPSLHLGVRIGIGVR